MEHTVHWLNPCVLGTQHNLSRENSFSLQSEDLGDCWPNLTATTATISNSGSSVKVGKEKSSKKRKAEKPPSVGSDDEYKKTKDWKNSSKKNRNNKKEDYIHVRARRGQATDSHSLAERVRRERISERMKYLQGLVPGCDRITGKAGMLDEIINYVQSLQRQVEFLSMKLAAVDPRLDLNMEDLFTEEITLPSNSNISTVDPSLILQFNSLQQAVKVPEPILDSSFNVQRTNDAWDSELHNLYGVEFHQGRETCFPPYSLVQGANEGNLEDQFVKLEQEIYPNTAVEIDRLAEQDF